MKIISLFNNKGGVGKSTLAFHIGYTLAEMGHRTLFIDLDPQCNLTICCMNEERLHRIWEEEDPFIDDFEDAFVKNPDITNTPRSIHFLLKPAEDGLSDLKNTPPVLNLDKNLDLIPGRLSVHKYENKIAERWNGAYQGDNLSIRTITNIRNICENYTELNGYEYIIIDTSPSLGILNKVIISIVDGFIIPAQPDMFSLYGIRNIGNSLDIWQKDFNTIYTLISSDKRRKFPRKFVQFLGYTIYNCKKYGKTRGESGNEYDLAQAHYQYVHRIPEVILEFIKENNRENLSQENISNPIGGKSIMHSHNTFPAMAQALNCPMWRIPEKWTELSENSPEYIGFLVENGFDYNRGNNGKLRELKRAYITFVEDLITRITTL